MIKAYAVPVPTDSALAPLYVGADLLDAFAIHLPAGASDDLEVLARAAFERQAGWIRALTWVRDDRSKPSMKFVTHHQTTLHLSFKIKCCVDRLRPPANKIGILGLEPIPGRWEIYWWPHAYDAAFLGYMEGALAISGFINSGALII
jgi:hypothetical protein